MRRNHCTLPSSWLPFIVLALMLAACDDDFEQTIEIDWITVRNVIPADSVVVPAAVPFAVTMRFQRDVRDERLEPRWIPPAASQGDSSFSTDGREITWHDVVLAEPDRLVHLLLDGPTLRQPVLHPLLTGGGHPRGSVAGFVRVDPSGPSDARGTLVFALAPDQPWNPLDPGTFADVVPAGISMVTSLRLDGEGGFRISGLEHGEYMVIGIMDTSGDGQYDVDVDWWGYHHVWPSRAPALVATSGAVAVADFVLGAP